MSSARTVPVKSGGTSTVIPPLPALPKLPSRLQPAKPSTLATTSRRDSKLPQPTNDLSLSSVLNRKDLENIVTHLTTITKKSEQLLTPVKKPPIPTTVRRTSSLHLTKIELDRRKLSHAALEKKELDRSKLHDSISDRSSECSTSVSRRNSIRPSYNMEKYSGIRCALPSFTSTVPHTFKGLDKHYTPVKSTLSGSTMSLMENQITPAKTHGRDKSPWRLRFEKFLNHEAPTPISPSTQAVALPVAKNPSSGKENRTPSFRLPARRMSKLNLPS